MDRRRPTRTARHVSMPAFVVGLATLTIAPTLGAQAPARVAVGRVVATGPQRRSLVAVRATSAIAIDGRLDDPAWRDAPVGRDFVQRSPDALRPSTQRTEARLLVDDVALYVALRLFDSAPDSIVAPLARRDADLYSDWAEVSIDGYLDHRAWAGVSERRRKELLTSLDRGRDDQPGVSVPGAGSRWKLAGV